MMNARDKDAPHSLSLATHNTPLCYLHPLLKIGVYRLRVLSALIYEEPGTVYIATRRIYRSSFARIRDRASFLDNVTYCLCAPRLSG